MERNFYTDDFERLLKERSDEFRMYPSKRVWHSIYNDLHPGRKWPSVAVSLLLIAALLITGYWNSNNHTTQTITASNQLPAGSVIADNGTTSGTLQQASVSNNNNSADYSTNSTSLKNTITTSVENTVSTTNKSNAVTVKAATGNNSKYNRGSAKVIYNNVTRNNYKNLIASQTASSPVNSAKTFNASDNQMFGSGNPVSAGKKVNADVAEQIINDAVAEKTTISKDIVSVASNTVNNENNIEPVTTANATGKSNDAITDKQIMQSSGAEKESVLIPNATANTNSRAKTTNKPSVSIQDKAWMDDYAFYNRSTRKKWKDRAAKEFYITPGITYRNFSNNSAFDPSGTTANALTVPFNSNSLNTSLSQKPGISLEAGIGFLYSLSKKLRVKAGIQANYTSYTIYGEKTNHPVLTTLRLTNINTGFPYLDPRTATLANSGLNKAKTHNTTLQISIPVGLAFKLAAAGKLEWYAASTIQPSFVIRGNANLISDDRKNYVADPSLLRRWNLNAGFETFIHYKMNGFTLQAGPQFRYQLLSTYASQYTINENLYNVGLKVGLIRNF